MTQDDALKVVPTRRIQSFDGMAVTAQVWDESHAYHQLYRRLHARHGHGTGILTGLEVIGSDPADRTVYLLPGAAVDHAGNTIVVKEPVAHQFNKDVEGLLYLFLTYGESGPKSPDGAAQSDLPQYVNEGFNIQARPTLPQTPHVEVARVWRESRTAPLLDAPDPTHPGPNQIDLRFRRTVGAAEIPQVSVGVVSLGGDPGPHEQGLDRLAHSLRHSGRMMAWVDQGISLDGKLSGYTLICLAAHGAFRLTAGQVDALRGYLTNGGTLFLEACHRESAPGDPPAQSSIREVAASLGISLAPVAGEHALLTQPFLFGAPTPGFESSGVPELVAGGGVVLSTWDYACLWQGQRRGQPATRAEIRSAQEWGENLMSFAHGRRAKAGG